MNFEHVDIIGAAGLLLAIVSLILQYKFWRDEHRERVTVKVEWGLASQTPSASGHSGRESLIIDVVNIGRVPVYIKEVVIERDASGEPPPSFGERPKDGIAKMDFKTEAPADEPLQVGQSQQYVLPEHGSGFVEKFISASEATLLVRSARGVVYAHHIRQITPLLTRYVEQERPKEASFREQLQKSAAAVEKSLPKVDRPNST